MTSNFELQLILIKNQLTTSAHRGKLHCQRVAKLYWASILIRSVTSFFLGNGIPLGYFKNFLNSHILIKREFSKAVRSSPWNSCILIHASTIYVSKLVISSMSIIENKLWSLALLWFLDHRWFCVCLLASQVTHALNNLKSLWFRPICSIVVVGIVFLTAKGTVQRIYT